MFSVLLYNVNTLFWLPIKANKDSMSMCVLMCAEMGREGEGTEGENNYQELVVSTTQTITFSFLSLHLYLAPVAHFPFSILRFNC